MKTKLEIQITLDKLRLFLEMGDNGPFAPEMRSTIQAVINFGDWVTGDNIGEDSAFERNVKSLMKWCEKNNIHFYSMPPTKQ